MRLKALESHAAGEPTRIIYEGFPDLGTGTMAERRARFEAEFDHLRKGIILEPRGSDVLVGALLQKPNDPSCDAGVIYFNNAGMLNMCGHGTMCFVRALDYLDRKPRGEAYRLETPVGVVEAKLVEDGWVEVENVPAYRQEKDVRTSLAVGDIAWGGNWFFITHDSPCPVNLAHLEALTDYTMAIRTELNAGGYPEVDHIEVCVDSERADSRNFVLCPGAAYDRSPCGTGTSAHMACLSADGILREGQEWRQESVIGSLFRGRVRTDGDGVIPTVIGPAFVNGELTMIFEDADPFRYGIC